MAIAAREALHEGTRVAYSDQANPRREGRIVEVIQRGGATPSGFALPTGEEYRVQWDDPRDGETVSDLRQHGWFQIADLPGSPFDGVDIIAAYTRERALHDGELVALDSIAQEAGYRVPVAVTRALWNLVDATPEEVASGQSTTGRLWDVLSMARMYGTRRSADASQFDFPTIFRRLGRGKPGGSKTYRLRFVVGPGDQGEPVATIGFPEDF